MTRYDVSGSEGQHEPGSAEEVLKNRLGIASVPEMNELELMLLQQLYEQVLLQELPRGPVTVAMLREWHRRWLGNVYEWAGQDRGVNMSKGGFAFAAAAQIPRLLTLFERDILARFTPCTEMQGDALVEAIATVHVEFILIHPFREGNGRLSRLLADVMAVQAGEEPLDYSSWDANKPAYIAAIHAGMSGDYLPMMRWVAKALGEE